MRISFHTSRLALAAGALGRIHKLRAVMMATLILGAYVTYVTLPLLRSRYGVEGTIEILILFCVACLILGAFGASATVIATALVQSNGQICIHSLSMEPEGLLEKTSVGQTLSVYSEIGMPYKRLGVWVIPVGPAIYAFRGRDIKEGSVGAFVDALKSHLRQI
jgi:hypothetical protein